MSTMRQIKARVINTENNLGNFYRGVPENSPFRFAVLDVSNPVALIKQVAVSMDTEDGTGAGYDYHAETILLGLGIITKRHVTNLPNGRARR